MIILKKKFLIDGGGINIFLQILILIFVFFDGQAQNNVKTGNIRGCDTWNFPTQTPNTLNNITVINGTEIQSNSNTASVNTMTFQNNGALVLNGAEAVTFGTTTNANICANFIENSSYDLSIIIGNTSGYVVGGNYNSTPTSGISVAGTAQIEFNCNLISMPTITCYYTDASGSTQLRKVGRANVAVKLYRQRGGTSTHLSTINFSGIFPSSADVTPISQTVTDNVMPGDKFYMSWSAVNGAGTNINGCWKLDIWYYGHPWGIPTFTGHLKISPINNSF